TDCGRPCDCRWVREFASVDRPKEKDTAAGRGTLGAPDKIRQRHHARRARPEVRAAVAGAMGCLVSGLAGTRNGGAPMARVAARVAKDGSAGNDSRRKICRWFHG